MLEGRCSNVSKPMEIALGAVDQFGKESSITTPELRVS